MENKTPTTENKPNDTSIALKLSEILQQLSDEGYNNAQVAKLFTTGFHLVHQHDVKTELERRHFIRNLDNLSNCR